MENKNFSGIRNNSLLPDPRNINIPDDSKDLIDDYIESTNSTLNKLEQAALSYEAGNNSEEDAATIRRILHKIKGEASMVGIEEITDISHQAEYAFEELNENQRPDMLLRYKDWICKAIHDMEDNV
jgi:HPt (histidine-containing phosphotransfer) domain-containing protein